LLVVLSTFNVGLGLHTFSRVRRQARRFWLVATILWGLLATGLLRFLLAR
jgi:heme/copper-type cytochrome/quinol oxidase subunit 3